MTNTDKNKYGYTKEEIKENQRKLKENPIKELLYPTISYWREKPARAIGQFLGWVIVVYSIMTLIQAINYDMIYCESSMEQYNGKIMRTYNPFVEEMNTKIERFNMRYTPIQLEGMPLPQELNQTIMCDYNLKRWWNENSDITYNIKELVIKRWVKNKNTN